MTVQKNGVVAINALTDALAAFKALYESFVGDKTYLGATDASLITSGSGRLVNMIISVAGSTSGTIHDAASVSSATTANVISIVPQTQ